MEKVKFREGRFTVGKEGCRTKSKRYGYLAMQNKLEENKVKSSLIDFFRP